MNIYLPGFEPDFPVRQELRLIGGILDLRQFDKIFISVSGGKDSHAMLFTIKELAENQGVENEKLVIMYANTGAEWHNTPEHVVKLSAASGIALASVYPVRPMIEQIKYRGSRLIERGSTRRDGIANAGVLFPSPRCRYCTQNQKIDPMDKYMRRFTGKLLKITGERWAENKARANYAEYTRVPRITSKQRNVYGWRPMLAWSEADVWAKIKETGVPRHECYSLGSDRLGCAGCIFSSDRDLKIEMTNNPEIFEALDRLETESGFTMSMDRRRIRERIK